ncbi:MAG: glucokinase [Sphingobium sp.]|jgi:glucokinase|nr:glucokinase [Sphingobium sp.]MCP5399214.1 glucokinase [Sphingomonas sp.]
MSREIVAVDIGGTNARFCRARIEAGSPPELGAIRKYKVADYPGLAEAWQHFLRDDGGEAPSAAIAALAGPIDRTPIKMTNSHWVVDPVALKAQMGLANLALVNDFEAIAYGVAALPHAELFSLFGPDNGLPEKGAISVIGPGTGLGVAIISMHPVGVRVLATEGGHVEFAPVDEYEDALLAQLRVRFGRVSTERVVSGPGLNALYQALGALAGGDAPEHSDAELWQQALGSDSGLARRALDQLCRSYGSVAGDLALAHGSKAVVLAGGLTGRMKDHPAFALFAERFAAKGRYRDLMMKMPIYYADHPEMGLFGAAAAAQVLVSD